jgi:hypothetical protein
MILSADSRYYLRPGGTAVPRVTTILDGMGFVSDFGKDDERAQRGTNCHSWAELVVLDRLPPEIPEQARPLVAAVDHWRKAHGVRPLILSDGLTPCVEHLVEYRGRYAGRLDLLDDQFRLWDWKFWAGKNRGAIYTAGLQTAGYEDAVRSQERIRKGLRRYVQWFEGSPDGATMTAHDPIRCDDPADHATFQAAVSVWWAKKRNGLL